MWLLTLLGAPPSHPHAPFDATGGRAPAGIFVVPLGVLLRVGRAATCEIRLAGAGCGAMRVSRTHCLLFGAPPQDVGSEAALEPPPLYVVDVSLCGTFVRGCRLPRAAAGSRPLPAMLRPRDVVALGGASASVALWWGSELLGRSDLRVTPICLGTMTFGEQVDEATAHTILSRSLERGVNFIDTAEMYAVPARAETCGATETIIGNWFAKNPGARQKLVLATKVAGPSRGMPWIRAGSGMTAEIGRAHV